MGEGLAGEMWINTFGYILPGIRGLYTTLAGYIQGPLQKDWLIYVMEHFILALLFQYDYSCS